MQSRSACIATGTFFGSHSLGYVIASRMSFRQRIRFSASSTKCKPRTATMKLYTYWRSQAAYRVRIALSLKGLETELIALDILKGEQFADEYRRINPQHAVPTLVDG